jgi:hypothetical protein
VDEVIGGTDTSHRRSQGLDVENVPADDRCRIGVVHECLGSTREAADMLPVLLEPTEQPAADIARRCGEEN